MKRRLPETVVFLFNMEGKVLVVHGECPRARANRSIHRTFADCARQTVQRMTGIDQIEGLRKLGVYDVPHDHVVAYVGLCRNPPPMHAAANFLPGVNAFVAVPHPEPWLHIADDALRASRSLRVQ